jgi:FkbM family methyltransferase
MLATAARITRLMPDKLGDSIAWRLAERCGRTPRIAKLRSGGRVAVDVGDYGHRHMYFRGEYEPDTTRLFASLSEPAWTVLDVGANVGYFSVIAAQCGGPGTTVVAFEPNPRVYEMLKQTSSLNGQSIIAPMRTLSKFQWSHSMITARQTRFALRSQRSMWKVSNLRSYEAPKTSLPKVAWGPSSLRCVLTG